MGVKHPRNALFLGLSFALTGIVYGITSRDMGGTTTLIALGIAMGLMAYVLVVGTPDEH
jgi:hypothetical protein